MSYKRAVLVIFSGLFLLKHSFAASVETNEIARGLDARGILSSLAGNLMSRGFATTGTGGSQVVSLNLTNLFVLVLLKALIFAAGSLGAGTWKGGLGRSSDGEEQIVTEDELLLYLSYLTGDNNCLQFISCQEPEQAKRYAAAGDMLLKASKMLSLESDTGHMFLLQEIEQAAEIGQAGGDCSRFKCSDNSK